jgi:hypothetical protein
MPFEPIVTKTESIQEYNTDSNGNPNGTLLIENESIQERGSKTTTGYIIVRWVKNQGVWIINHVYTLSNKAAESLKNELVKQYTNE